jgi:hypothetical protein
MAKAAIYFSNWNVNQQFLAELVIHNGTFLLPHARGSESLAPVRIDNAEIRLEQLKTAKSQNGPKIGLKLRPSARARLGPVKSIKSGTWTTYNAWHIIYYIIVLY